MPYGVAGGIGSDTKCRNLESLFCRETDPKLTTSKRVWKLGGSSSVHSSQLLPLAGFEESSLSVTDSKGMEPMQAVQFVIL
jgi:hypothetical protein